MGAASTCRVFAGALHCAPTKMLSLFAQSAFNLAASTCRSRGVFLPFVKGEMDEVQRGSFIWQRAAQSAFQNKDCAARFK